IAEAKRDLGGGQIYTGQVTGDKSGKLVFETDDKDPSPSMDKTLKTVITRDAGLTLQVDSKRAPDPAAAKTSSGPGPAAPAPKPDDAAAKEKDGVLNRLKALVPHATRVLASKSPSVPAIRAKLANVKALIDKKDFAAANKELDALEKLISESG